MLLSEGKYTCDASLAAVATRAPIMHHKPNSCRAAAVIDATGAPPAVDSGNIEVSAALPGAAVSTSGSKRKSGFSFLNKGASADVPSAAFDADSAAVEGSAPGADVDVSGPSGAAGSLPAVGLDADGPSVSFDAHASDARGPDLVIPGADVSMSGKQTSGSFRASGTLPDIGEPHGIHGPDMTMPTGGATMPSGEVGVPSGDVDVGTPSGDVSAPDVHVSAGEGGLGSYKAGVAAGAAGVAGALGAAGGYAAGKLKGDKPEVDAKLDAPDVDVDAPSASLDVDVDKPKKGFFSGMFGRKKGDVDVSASLPGACCPHGPLRDAQNHCNLKVSFVTVDHMAQPGAEA